MASTTHLPNLLIKLWAELQDVAFLWQAGATLASLLVAWLVRRATQPHLVSRKTEPSVGRDVVAAIQFPLVAVLLILFARLLLDNKDIALLNVMIALLTAAIIIRLVVVMLRQVFAPSGWRDSLIRMIATVIWIGFALYVAGLLPDVIKFMDGLGFSVGKQRISLFLILQGLLSVLVTLLFALWLGRYIETRAMAASDLDINLRVMISKFAQALLVLTAILIALPAVGIDLTVLSLFGGALGVGLGFGLQKIASNYISGFIILMDRSVSLGDLVTIDQQTGQLTKMTARYVVVRSLNGIESIVPNDSLITATVVNHSYSDKLVQQAISIQVGYDSKLEQAMQLMEEAALRQTRVQREPAPKALLIRFADSGVDLELGYWVDDPQTGTAKLRSDLQLDIWHAFRAHNIDIPYPQRTVRLIRETEAPRQSPENK